MEPSMALFPPGKGGGQSIDYGYKGKGVTTHLLVDGNGMPLSVTATSASGSEREQVSPLLKRVRIYHGYDGFLQISVIMIWVDKLILQ